MKTLILTNLYPSTREPTRGMFNLQGFRALSRYCEVRLVAPVRWWARTRTPRELFTVPVERSTGLEAAFPTYWHLPRAHRLHGWSVYQSLRPYVHRLRREFPFEAILAAWAYPDGYAAARLGEELGCPVVTMVLGSDLNELARKPLLREQIRTSLMRNHRIITVSHALRARVEELGLPRERVLVQHNGVDGERFQPRNQADARQRLGLSSQRPLICYVGNLVQEKGVDLLVEAMAQLRGNGQREAELVLVGGGDLEIPLRERARELGIEDAIRFCGKRPHTEIPDWITAADVFCLPSRREGCPNVVLEALASGRPVVAAAVGGVPELLAQDNGLLTPPEDPQALAENLQAALQRPWNPDRLRATVPCLSWDRFGKTLYETLADATDCSQKKAVAA